MIFKEAVGLQIKLQSEPVHPNLGFRSLTAQKYSTERLKSLRISRTNTTGEKHKMVSNCLSDLIQPPQVQRFQMSINKCVI